MVSPKWQQFERIVTAIHIAQSKGARVEWDEKIDGRQFDVSVRHANGVYDYLTLIECKRYTAPIPVDKVEAFVTKVRSAKADKAVIVSSSGYQSGCMKVAAENKVTLITLSEKWVWPGGSSTGVTETCWQLFDVQVHLTSGSAIFFPQRGERTANLVQRSVLRDSSGLREALAEAFAKDRMAADQRGDDKPAKQKLPFKGYSISVPYFVEDAPLDAVSFSAELVDVQVFRGPAMSEHYRKALGHEFVLFDELTQKTTTVRALGLPLGFDTVLEAGKFYTNLELGNNYFIEKIENGKAAMCVVEAYAGPMLAQIFCTQSLAYQKQYVEVTDSAELDWLKRLYKAALATGKRKRRG